MNYGTAPPKLYILSGEMTAMNGSGKWCEKPIKSLFLRYNLDDMSVWMAQDESNKG